MAVVTKKPPAKPWQDSLSAFSPDRIERLFERLNARPGVGHNGGPAFDSAKLFQATQPPPGVLPEGLDKKLAMDWAPYSQWAGNAYGAMGAEGTLFFGYPYLSELTQRAEYRVIAETIAEEVTRKFGEVKAKGGSGKEDKVARIEAEFKRLKIRDKVRKADQLDSFFGRSHWYLDFGVKDTAEIIMPVGNGWDEASKSKCGPATPLRGIRVFEPLWSYPGPYNSSDPLADDWYCPQTWYLMSRQIHRTRFLTFVSREMPDILKAPYMFGGLSLSQMAQPYIEIWLNTRQSVATLVQNFTMWCLSTDMQTLVSGATQDKLVSRILSLVAGKNGGVMVSDKETEELKNISAPIAGLSALQAQAQEHMAAVSKIPLVKLTGISPSGLNASSEGEIQVFGDMIHARQEFLHNDHVHTVLGFVQLSLFGEVDPDITFEWAPMEEMNDKELAELRKMEAETDGFLIDKGIISPGEARKRVAEDQESPYDGLDPDTPPDLLLEETQGLIPKGGGAGEAEELPGGGGSEDEDVSLADGAPHDPWAHVFGTLMAAGGAEATNDQWRAAMRIALPGSAEAPDASLDGWRKAFTMRGWL